MTACTECTIDGLDTLLKKELAVETRTGFQLSDYAYSILYGCSRGGFNYAGRKSLPQPPSYSEFKHDALFHLAMEGFCRNVPDTGSRFPVNYFVSTDRIEAMVKEASKLVDDEILERYYEILLKGIKV